MLEMHNLSELKWGNPSLQQIPGLFGRKWNAKADTSNVCDAREHPQFMCFLVRRVTHVCSLPSPPVRATRSTQAV